MPCRLADHCTCVKGARHRCSNWWWTSDRVVYPDPNVRLVQEPVHSCKRPNACISPHCLCYPTSNSLFVSNNLATYPSPEQIAVEHEKERSDIWDRRFIGLAAYIANEWSKDPSTKVGAVLVDPDTRTILGTGYNGFPRGVRDDPERLADRAQKYPRIVHAEVNAILTASASVRGATIYTSPFAPCNECAKMIIQAGIRRVVSPAVKIDRWSESNKIAAEMFAEAGVRFDVVE